MHVDGLTDGQKVSGKDEAALDLVERDVLIPRRSRGDWVGERAEIGRQHQLLLVRTATRGAEGKNSQLERAGSRAEQAVERTRRTGCQAICTRYTYRWAKRCKFFWEDLS